MAIPMEENMQLPLLRVIADAGGKLTPKEAVERVTAFFPQLTEQDKQLSLPSGKGFLFTNRVQWTRQRLVDSGHLYREPRGLWRITPQGKQFLEDNWSSWQPRYSTDESGSRREGREIITGPAPQSPVLRTHEHLKELLRQVGDILGYYPEIEFHEPPYVYDVVWKSFPQAPGPRFVFEVQDKGNLIEALAKLEHAKETWGSKLFLTVTGDRDRKRIDKLVTPLLKGTFHRLAKDLVLLPPEQIERLYEPLNQNRDLIRRLLQE